MGRTIKRLANGKRGKAEVPGRSKALLDRIRRRREQIRKRVGLLSDSSELIREEREHRF